MSTSIFYRKFTSRHIKSSSNTSPSLTLLTLKMNFASLQAAYPSPDPTPTTSRFRPVDSTADQPIRTTALSSHFANLGRKRHRKILRDNLPAAFSKSIHQSIKPQEGLPTDTWHADRSTIRKLARRGGVKRIRKEIYPTVQQVMRDRLEEVRIYILLLRTTPLTFEILSLHKSRSVLTFPTL